MFIQLNKTSEQVRDDILAGVPDKYQKTAGFFTWDFAAALSIELKRIWDKIAYVCGFGDINNFEYDDLVKFVYQRRGIIAKTATRSNGLLKVSVGSGTISKNDLFETSDGLQFCAVETKTVAEGDTFKVECLKSGAAGNVAASAITVIPATIAGIVSVTNESAFTNGYDAETKSALIERYLDDLQKPITSGNIYHYQKWAKECLGVGNAKTKPLWQGENTVKVVIVDSNYEIASANLITEVQNYIDPYSTVDGQKIGWGCGNGEAPIGAYCTVTSADAKSIDVSAVIILKSGADLALVKDNIENDLKYYLKSIVFSDEFVSYAKIGAVVLSADGVKDYKNLLVNNDNDNIVLTDSDTLTEIPILRTLTVSEETLL